MKKMLRDLQLCAATFAFCSACSSTNSQNSPTGQGGTGGAAATEVEAGAGITEAGTAEAGQAGAGTTEAGQAGQAGESEAGGAKSTAGSASSAGGTNTAGSGGASSGSCSNVDSECGGNVVGSWAASVTCVAVSEVVSGPFAGCQGASYRLMLDSTITFGADLSYQQSSNSTQATEIVDLPKGCVSGGSCATVASAFTELMNKSIVDKGSVCEVSGTLEDDSATKSGTYVASGNTFVIDGKTSRPLTFCVAGDTLILKEIQDHQVVVTTFTRI